MKAMMEIDINETIGYGIYDEVTNQWLCDFPDTDWSDDWTGGPSTGDVFQFKTVKDAINAANQLTKKFKSHQKDVKINWCIYPVSSHVRIQRFQKTGRLIKRIAT